MVLGFARRSLLGAVLVLLLSLCVVVQSAKPAEAFAPAPAVMPVLTAVAPAAAAGPPGWLIAGGIVVGVGAWYAYSNRDELVSFFNDKFSSDPTAPSQTDGQWVQHIFGFTYVGDNQWPTFQFQWGPGVNGRATSLTTRVDLYATCKFGTSFVTTKIDAGLISNAQGGLYPPVNMAASTVEAHFDLCVASSGSVVSLRAERRADLAPLGLWVAPNYSDQSRNQAKQKCLRPDGSTFTLTGPETLSVTQPATITIPSCSAADPGSMGTKVDMCSRSANGGDELKCAGTGDLTEVLGTGGQFELCGPGNEPCTLRLLINGQQCQVGMVGCTDWYQRIGTAYETLYSCYWGPYLVPLQSCKLLKDHFVPGVDRDPNTDLPLPQPAPDPNPTPDPGGGTDTFPDSGLNELPGNGPELDESEFSQCMGAGWSWNPVSWVYVPTRCALSWAFVPEPELLETEFAGLQSAWQGTRVPEWAEWGGTIGTAFEGFGAGSGGCAGPHFDITLAGRDYAFDPLNACSPPMSTVAVVIKVFVTVFAILAGFRLVMRPVSHAVGMGGASD